MKINIAIFVLLIIPLSVFSQKDKKSAYKFTETIRIKDTPVKNQQRSGTCWSFAAISFLETELLRTKDEEFDLSEMFFVHLAYQQKAKDYVQLHGKSNFSEGGQAHDVTNLIEKYGAVSEDVYHGLEYGGKIHIHTEMEAVMKAMLNIYVSNPNNKLSTVWFDAIASVLNIYMGKIPEKFKYNNIDYSPLSFSKHLNIKKDDYIELTSLNLNPYYQQFILKIPDNWSKDLYYNLPINDFMQTIDNALENGYSICWDGDVSEKCFSFKNGVAIVPEKSWNDLSEKERKDLFQSIVAEKEITQESRQKTYDNYTTTDDHLMHIIGIAKDQNGNKYYITKNSWGKSSNLFNGYLYMSESYVKLKTIAIMIHKDALPENIVNKLSIKQ